MLASETPQTQASGSILKRSPQQIYTSLYLRGDDEKLLLQKQESTEKPYAGFHLCVTPKNSVIGQENCVGYTNKGNFEEFFGKMLVDVEDGRW
jgi:hypothetical protein